MKHYFLKVTTQGDDRLQCNQYVGEFENDEAAKWYLMDRLRRCKYLPISMSDYQIEFSGFLSPTTLHKGVFPFQYPSDAPTNYYFNGLLYTLEPEDAL